MFRKRTEKLLSGLGVDPGALQQLGGLRAQMDYRAMVQRVMATGVEMPATIRSVTVGSPMANGHNVHLELEVQPPDRSPYAASVDQPLPEAVVTTLAAGQRVTVKAAAGEVMLWNTPHAAGGADPDTGEPLAPSGASVADDRVARLERLQQLRTTGVLTEEEFQAQKARLLAS
jgi:hypothetical protein